MINLIEAKDKFITLAECDLKAIYWNEKSKTMKIEYRDIYGKFHPYNLAGTTIIGMLFVENKRVRLLNVSREQISKDGNIVIVEDCEWDLVSRHD